MSLLKTTQPEKPSKSKSDSNIKDLKLGCGGMDDMWINIFITGLKDVNKTNPKLSEKLFTEIAKIVNDISHKFQEITYDAGYYFLEDNDHVKGFIESANSLCNKIQEYCKSLGKKTKEDESERRRTSILFTYHQEFEEKYTKAKTVIDSLKQFIKEQKDEKTLESSKIVSMLSGSAVTALTKIWEVKIYIYIVGVLLYNIYVYVFPLPISSMLNEVIKIFGVICYSIGTDAVLFDKAIQFINIIVMKLGTFVFMFFAPFLNRIIDSKIVRTVNCIMSYIFTCYCFGWLSKILIGICKTVTILLPTLKATVQTGGSIAEFIVNNAIELGTTSQQQLYNIATYAISSLSQVAPIILEGLIVFFSNYAAATTSSIYSYLSSGFKGGKDSLDKLINQVLNMWKSPSKELVTSDDSNGQLIDFKEGPFMIIDKKNQIVAAKIIELFLNNKKALDDTREAEDAEHGVFVDTKNPIFHLALTNTTEGYTLDVEQLHRNLQRVIPPINVKEVIEKGFSETKQETEKNFEIFFNEALTQSGLTELVSAMTYSLTSENQNIPSLILLHLFTADKIVNYITLEPVGFQKVILSILLICTLLVSLRLI
jgi:hypothetical protein